MIGWLLPGAAVVLDAGALAAEAAGHDDLAEYAKGGATGLRALALVLRGRGPAQP